MGDEAKVLSFPQASKVGKLPRRAKNKDVRSREYLTEQEVELLVNAARKTGRHGHRDATLIIEDNSSIDSSPLAAGIALHALDTLGATINAIHIFYLLSGHHRILIRILIVV